jgi:hypothetical protein
MASASCNTMSGPELIPIAEKFTRSNFPLWKALVVSALKGAQLSKFLEGKVEVPPETLASDDKKMEVPNPEFATYVAKQQQMLNFLFSSLSKEMLEYVAAYTTRGGLGQSCHDGFLAVSCSCD